MCVVKLGKIVPNARAASPDGYSECGYTCVLLNSKIIPNARVTSPDGYSECGYTCVVKL